MAKEKSNKLDTYHHGNLRDACVRKGVEFLSEGNLEFSMRDIARSVGVSNGAPARHFGNKEGLLAAISEEGFKKFNQHLEKSFLTNKPKETFYEMNQNYMRFALTFPHHYQLMFSHKVSHENYPSLADEGRKAFGQLIKMVSWLQEEEIFSPGNTLTKAFQIWSGLHGVVSLSITGVINVGMSTDLIEAEEILEKDKYTEKVVMAFGDSIFAGLSK